MENYWPYVIVMAAVTYLVRVVPLTVMRREITNDYILSFLYYVPYACLAAMVFPAILYSTDWMISAALGLAAALVTAYFERSMFTVALVSCGTVFVAERVLEAAAG